MTGSARKKRSRARRPACLPRKLKPLCNRRPRYRGLFFMRYDLDRAFVQQQLQPAHLTCGRMQLLETKTGMSADQIARLYNNSGARFFGQFGAAVLAAQRLGVDRDQVLQRIRTQSLLSVLESMGIDEQRGHDAIWESVQEEVASEKQVVLAVSQSARK